MPYLNILLKLSLMTSISSAFATINLGHPSNVANKDNKVFNDDLHSSRNISSFVKEDNSNLSKIDLTVGLGSIVSNAFDANIDTVANIVEGNPEYYERTLIDGKYWAKSEKFEESIENLKKLFTSVWSEQKDEYYYQQVVQGFVAGINRILEGSCTAYASNNKNWITSDNGKAALGLLNGLVAFRTLYIEKTAIEKTAVDNNGTALTFDRFDAVFEIVKSDDYYSRILEYFNNDEELFRNFVQHDWKCYFQQFNVLLSSSLTSETSDTDSNNVSRNLEPTMDVDRMGISYENQDINPVVNYGNSIIMEENDEEENNENSDDSGEELDNQTETNNEGDMSTGETDENDRTGQSVVEIVNARISELYKGQQMCLELYNTLEIGTYKESFEDLVGVLFGSELSSEQEKQLADVIAPVFKRLEFKEAPQANQYDTTFMGLVYRICEFLTIKNLHNSKCPSLDTVVNSWISISDRSSFGFCDMLTTAAEAVDFFDIDLDDKKFEKIINNILSTENNRFWRMVVHSGNRVSEEYLAPLFAYISEKFDIDFNKFIQLFTTQYNNFILHEDNRISHEKLLILIMNTINNIKCNTNINGDNFEALVNIANSLKWQKLCHNDSDLYKHVVLLSNYFYEFYNNSSNEQDQFDINEFLQNFLELQRTLKFYMTLEDIAINTNEHWYCHILTENLVKQLEKQISSRVIEIPATSGGLSGKILCLIKIMKLIKTTADRICYYHLWAPKYQSSNPMDPIITIINIDEWIREWEKTINEQTQLLSGQK